ncbi:MAG: PfkB family carbohydrate kinase, partial [Candidatus Eisenbacteria bacterium]|nr:PfkB family carbohydrate kinase [Candidatus Eisenbacteria bacterium]
TPFGEASDMLGGSAVYFALAASLFVPVSIVGVVGTDFSESHMDLLRSKGVDLQGLQMVAGRTFRWGGKYGYDLNQRETLFTELNVFEHFRPSLPDCYRETPYLFLGNIDPDLQGLVLDQLRSPVMVAGDTMNFWINGKRDSLLAVISRLDVLLLNDSEVRLLTDEPNLVRAARHVLRRGPKSVVIKKGEHGAMMLLPESCFFAPPFPLEMVVDPTGAGDSFAGGFMGYLAGCDVVGEAELRRAVMYGSVVASFSVEDFGVRRLARLTREEVEGRAMEFGKMTVLDLSRTDRGLREAG